MAPISNKTFVYTKIPEVQLLAGEHLVVEDRPIDLDATPLEGGILLKIFYASFDPYIRDRTRDPAIEDFIPALDVGSPVSGAVVGRILRSESPRFNVGDVVGVFYADFAEYAVVPGDLLDLAGTRKIENPHGLRLSYFLGVLGMPGATAYQGLYNIGKPKKGETIFVNSAAGVVGQIVGQLAKAEGLTVIGSAGSKAKIDYIVNELGFDGAFNYKEEETGAALKRLAPGGIDLCWDGVGGEQLDAALAAFKDKGRLISCGSMTMYASKPEDFYGVKNLWMLPNKRIKMEGFIVDLELEAYLPFVDALAPRIASGEIKVLEDVTVGVENAPEGLAGIFTGKNFGKAILKVAEPDAQDGEGSNCA